MMKGHAATCLALSVHVAAAWAGSDLAQGTTAADDERTVVLPLESRVFGNTRAIRVHVPIGYDDPENSTRRYPVLYLNDGFAVFSPSQWGAPRIVDELTRQGLVVPMILVGIDNAASIPGSRTPDRDRTAEFLPYPDPLEPDVAEPQGAKYPDFVVQEVMPFVEAEFRLTAEPAETVVGGASYGGIAALTTWMRYPERFGGVLLESTPTFLFGGRLVTESAVVKPVPRRVYVGVGTRETDDAAVLAALANAPQTLADVLPTLVLVNRVEGATHSSGAWRARLPTALEFLFGPDGG